MFGLPFLNPWIMLGALVALVGVGVGGFQFGVKYESGASAQKERMALTYIADLKDKQRAEVDKIRSDKDAEIVELEKQLLLARENIRIVTRTITKEVPVYVTQEADARCVVPVGFVSLWNRSTADPADSGNPAAAPEAGVVLDAPSGVALSAVAEAAVENHGAYWAVVNEVKARDKYIDELLDYINQIRKANQ